MVDAGTNTRSPKHFRLTTISQATISPPVAGSRDRGTAGSGLLSILIVLIKATEPEPGCFAFSGAGAKQLFSQEVPRTAS